MSELYRGRRSYWDTNAGWTGWPRQCTNCVQASRSECSTADLVLDGQGLGVLQGPVQSRRSHAASTGSCLRKVCQVRRSRGGMQRLRLEMPTG